MGDHWTVDKCRDCGGLRQWGPHDKWECIVELKQRIDNLSERVEYLARAINYGDGEDE